MRSCDTAFGRGHAEAFSLSHSEAATLRSCITRSSLASEHSADATLEMVISVSEGPTTGKRTLPVYNRRFPFGCSHQPAPAPPPPVFAPSD